MRKIAQNICRNTLKYTSIRQIIRRIDVYFNVWRIYTSCIYTSVLEVDVLRTPYKYVRIYAGRNTLHVDTCNPGLNVPTACRTVVCYFIFFWQWRLFPAHPFSPCRSSVVIRSPAQATLFLDKDFWSKASRTVLAAVVLWAAQRWPSLRPLRELATGIALGELFLLFSLFLGANDGYSRPSLLLPDNPASSSVPLPSNIRSWPKTFEAKLPGQC